MKKASALIAVFAATAMMAATAGCSGGNTPTSSNTQSVQETTEKTTEKATEKPTEPPTERPTEDMKNTAYQAYLEYLHSHPEWFTNAEQDFIRATEKCLIAIYDINGYYKHLIKFMDVAINEHFIRDNCNLLYRYCDNPEDVIEYIENDKRVERDVHTLKNG